MGVFIRFMGSPDCDFMKIAMGEVYFQGMYLKKNPFGGFWGHGWPLKRPKGQNPWEWVKYEWNGPPQPQMVGFCDLVGTGIAPVSKKVAVKAFLVGKIP